MQYVMSERLSDALKHEVEANWEQMILVGVFEKELFGDDDEDDVVLKAGVTEDEEDNFFDKKKEEE